MLGASEPEAKSEVQTQRVQHQMEPPALDEVPPSWLPAPLRVDPEPPTAPSAAFLALSAAEGAVGGSATSSADGFDMMGFDYAEALNRPPSRIPERANLDLLCRNPNSKLGDDPKLKAAWEVAKSMSLEALQSHGGLAKDAVVFPFAVSSAPPSMGDAESMVPVKTLNEKLSEAHREFEKEVSVLRCLALISPYCQYPA